MQIAGRSGPDYVLEILSKILAHFECRKNYELICWCQDATQRRDTSKGSAETKKPCPALLLQGVRVLTPHFNLRLYTALRIWYRCLLNSIASLTVLEVWYRPRIWPGVSNYGINWFKLLTLVAKEQITTCLSDHCRSKSKPFLHSAKDSLILLKTMHRKFWVTHVKSGARLTYHVL